MVARPEVAFMDDPNNQTANPRVYIYPHVLHTFTKQVSALVHTIEYMGNPLLEDTEVLFLLEQK